MLLSHVTSPEQTTNYLSKESVVLKEKTREKKRHLVRFKFVSPWFARGVRKEEDFSLFPLLGKFIADSLQMINSFLLGQELA